MAALSEAASTALATRRFDLIRRNPTIVIGALILGLLATLALIAPWIADDPLGFDPLERLRRPSA